MKSKKELGVFYTKDKIIIEKMINNIDVLCGKILEPSSGDGEFIVAIITKIIKLLQSEFKDDLFIIKYISENIYFNDIDENSILHTKRRVEELIKELIPNLSKEIIKKFLNFNSFTLDFIIKNQFQENYFDLIIGNPPFITLYGRRSINMTNTKREYYNTFDFVINKKKNNKFNVVMFFLENSLKYMKDNGMLSFILDVSFFEDAYIDIRRYILEKYNIISIIENISNFENVNSGQIILTINNKKNKFSKIIDFKDGTYVLIDNNIWKNDFKYRILKPFNKIEENIMNKMNKYERLGNIFKGKSLRTCAALTGRTADFILNNNEIFNNELKFPFLEGSKGVASKFSKPYYTKILKYDYDLQIKISNEFKIELEKKGVKNKKRVTLGDDNSYNSPKIFIRQSSKELICTYTEDKYSANNSLYILTNNNLKDEYSKKILKYVTGLLNSDLMTFYAKKNNIIRENLGKIPQIKISDLKTLPLNIDNSNFEKIIILVEKLLNKQDSDIFDELNKLIYSIYNISNEEIVYIKNTLF